MPDTWTPYTKNAAEYTQKYEAVRFEDAHGSWRSHWPEANALVLDIGAGSGRDAAWLAGRGCSVVAVEPASGMRQAAGLRHPEPRIQWLDDSLPSLEKVLRLNLQFDLILLSAVWQHVAPGSRERAFRKIASLLKPGGRFVVTLRLGSVDDGRVMYPVSADELVSLAGGRGLEAEILNPDRDFMGRGTVRWQTVLLTRQDDGTAGLVTLRQIIVNDSKSSTHKLGLLYVLAMIAAYAPGYAVRRQERVEIPLGLVGLYWLRAYVPLLARDFYQAPGQRLDKAFMKGAAALRDLLPFELQPGRGLSREKSADLKKAITASVRLIEKMPAHFIRYPRRDKPVFRVERVGRTGSLKAQAVTRDFLAAFGRFEVPVRIWDSLVHHGVWVEPTIMNEWTALMRGYTPRAFSYDEALEVLTWEQADRETAEVQKLIRSRLYMTECVWCGGRGPFDVDHVIPFSLTRNNDLWNLVPACRACNGGKSNKMTSAEVLAEAKWRIMAWWQGAYLELKELTERFTIEIEAALPLALELGHASPLENYIDAMFYQIKRLKSDYLLAEWEGRSRADRVTEARPKAAEKRPRLYGRE